MFRQLQLHRGRPADVRNADLYLHGEVLRISNLYALVIRQQRAEPPRVSEKVVALPRRFWNGELAGEVESHLFGLRNWRRRSRPACRSNRLQNVLVSGTPARIPGNRLENVF